MKRSLKLKERLGALLLAALFAMQAILGLLPVDTVQAAVKSIEVWKTDQMLEYEYRFNMKYQPGVTTYETFGCDNKDSDAFSDHGRSERDTESVRVSADYKPGSAGIRYNNVGKDGAGNIVDVRLTLMGVENAERRYDIRTPISKTENNGGLSFGWENNESYPIVGFSKNSIGVFIYSVGSAKINFQFLKHGTEETLPIRGHGTIRDIDAAQAVEIPVDSNLDHAYVLADNDFLKVNGTYVGSQNVAIEPDDEKGWMNMLYDTDNFNLVFSHQEKLDMWDASREASIAKAGSQEKWAQSLINKYVDASGNSYCPNFKGQKVCRGFAYFDFTSYCFGDIEMKKAPEKRVGETDSTWEQAVAATKDQPFAVRQGKEFQYLIQAEVTPNKLRSFVVQDTLEECLRIEDASKVSITNDVGQDVTDQFDISVDGQKITCSAKTESLQDEAFTDNQTYTFILKVQLRPESEMNVSKYIADDGYTILIPNHASMSYERMSGKGDTMDTDTVWVKSVIPPELEVTKNVSAYEWKVGDTVDYEITVSQTKQDVRAVNVVITDEIPACLQLLEGQYTAETSGGAANCTLTRLGDNGWKAECPSLRYGEKITVRFKCQALETSNGMEWENIVSATADNLIDPATGEQESRKDMAEVWPNSPRLEINKTADKYEWQTGEQVAYRIVVNNVSAGTIAKNVNVTDIGLPQGLVLAGGADSVEVLGVQQKINYPVPDKKTGQAYETRQVETRLDADQNGFAFYCSYLPYSIPVTIIFHCIAQDEADGHESVNAASVKASNAEERSDDAEVYVNTAVLSIDKSFQNSYLAAGDGRVENEFRVGEQVNYQVTVNNLQKGSIARNLVISDLSLPEGLALDGDEGAVTVSGVPAVIQDPVAGTDDAGNELNPENYNETIEKPVTCQVARQGTGWIVTISDLPYQTPVTVNFRCMAQESVNGLEVVNTAQAYADNAQTVKDTSKVWINSPVLKIEKNADKPFYKYGDIITYRIVLTQEHTGCVARDVTVNDVIDTQGVRLLKDSVILMDENGNVTDADVQINDDNTFVMNTGKALIKDSRYSICDNDRGGLFEQVMYNPLDCQMQKSMIVEYQAAVIDEALDGQKVHNTAVVNSRENIPASDEEEVEVHSPILEIVKESDKKEYVSGEKGYYKLTVRQLREDVTDSNIVIEDAFENKGATLVKDSIFVKKNGVKLNDIKVEASETGFKIETGTTLSDMDKIEVCYEVVFETESTGSETIVNTAKAKGDSSPETSVQNEVYVKSVPKPTTSGTCPKMTPVPTKTPVPSYSNGNGGNGNSSYGSSGGYSSGYGSYQNGSVAGSFKTGDTRPFKAMAVAGILGLGLLAGGVLICRKSAAGRKDEKRMLRK